MCSPNRYLSSRKVFVITEQILFFQEGICDHQTDTFFPGDVFSVRGTDTLFPGKYVCSSN